MDHALTLHSDGTLTITLPKDAEVSRVVVNGASYRQVTGKLDLIRRQDAIEACESIKRSAIIEDGETLVRKSAVKYVLENLPSTEPERFNPCTVCQEFDCTGLVISISCIL